MIEDILRSKIGLDIERIGKSCIDSSIQRRMEDCGVRSLAEYTRLVSSSREELDNLIEAVTIPETWFFRSRESFEYLEYFVKTEWLAQVRAARLRVLSLPCCSGEEPYSIAITLLDCGLPPEIFAIDGIDISSVVLAKAAKGVYSRNSFRGSHLDFRDKYFRESGGSYELKSEVKKTVSFYKRNLLEYPEGPDFENVYDIIFCRNLFIYLDMDAQKKAVATLSRLLKEDGLLFLGHAETEVLAGSPFVSVKARGSFAFRKSESGAPGPLTDTQKLLKIDLFREKARFEKQQQRLHMERPRHYDKKTKKTEQKPVHVESVTDGDLLKNAQKLADSGDLEKASAACKKYLSANKLDPDAYALMGIILMSSGRDAEAEGFLSKALYLKPDYYEALLNFAALKARNGDKDAAARLKARAAKAGK